MTNAGSLWRYGLPWRTRRLTCEADTPEGALDWVEKYVGEHVEPDAYEMLHVLSTLKVYINIRRHERGDRFKRRVCVMLDRRNHTRRPWDV